MGALSPNQVITYSYASTRVSARRSQILSAQSQKALADSSNMAEFIRALEGTPYRTKIPSAKADAYALEAAFIEDLAAAARFVEDIAPDKVKPYFTARSRRIEVEYLKDAFVAIHQGRTPQPRWPKAALTEKISGRITALNEAKTIEEAAKALDGTIYYGAMEESVRSRANRNGMPPTTLPLDRLYYSLLWKEAANLSGSDGKTARNLTGLEIDKTNVLNYIRALRLGYSLDAVVIPAYVNVPQHLFKSGITDEGEWVAAFKDTHLGRRLTGLMPEAGGPLTQLEAGLRRLIHGEYRKAYSENQFGLGRLAGYLHFKEVEVENIRAAAVNAAYGLSVPQSSWLLI
ncbi:V-type ATP synthase subunit C [uncultured archaeon]|nr:V-type ATP synthase subunit C [uncultured archaeon]